MTEKKLKTESYKGVRDFYPEDMAIQRYIFDTWSKTAESFGYERYDASILEPSDLYKSKGAENAEIINDQSYTFIDRGEREVTLRPEMTPTIARMVAGKKRELKFPLRWYSIPNLFRYERPQRGRLREHWQLNCDLFGSDDYTADIEIIALAYQTLIDFGATPDMFEIRVNNRNLPVEIIRKAAKTCGVRTSSEQERDILRVFDRYHKISNSEFEKNITEIIGSDTSDIILQTLGAKNDHKSIFKSCEAFSDLVNIIAGLGKLNIEAKSDSFLTRGFDYYTGTVFEIFDKSGENNRSLLGGGRYDNLTSMFDDEPISGVGFGMGDVTMRDFLETHKLLPSHLQTTAPTLTIIPVEPTLNLEAQKIAQIFRTRDIRVATDIGTKKLGKKITDAVEKGVVYAIIVGEDEIKSNSFTLKNLEHNSEENGNIDELSTIIITNKK
jgi:histidyl-tRNA synthetase